MNREKDEKEREREKERRGRKSAVYTINRLSERV